MVWFFALWNVPRVFFAHFHWMATRIVEGNHKVMLSGNILYLRRLLWRTNLFLEKENYFAVSSCSDMTITDLVTELRPRKKNTTPDWLSNDSNQSAAGVLRSPYGWENCAIPSNQSSRSTRPSTLALGPDWCPWLEGNVEETQQNYSSSDYHSWPPVIGCGIHSRGAWLVLVIGYNPEAIKLVHQQYFIMALMDSLGTESEKKHKNCLTVLFGALLVNISKTKLK